MWFSIGKKLVTAEWFHIDQDSNQKNEAYLQTIKNRTYKPDLLLNLPKHNLMNCIKLLFNIIFKFSKIL